MANRGFLCVLKDCLGTIIPGGLSISFGLRTSDCGFWAARRALCRYISLSLYLSLSPCACTPIPVDPEEPFEEIALDDLSQWRAPTADWQIVGEAFSDPSNERKLSAREGTGILLNGPNGRTRNAFTKMEHGDIEAHIEFLVPKGSNSGVYFQGRYEIQVLDSWGVKELKHGDCGGIYQRWDGSRDPKGFDGRPPRANASRPPGEWQTFDVVFRAPRFDENGRKTANGVFVKVVHNGTVVHENQEVTGPTRAAAFGDERPTGPIMLQGDHGPVAYRNIRVRRAK